jgi:hypothetical protein
LLLKLDAIREGIGIFAVAKIAHLIDDKTVAKMGHPVVVVWSDVGHPSEARNDIS